MHAWQQGQRVLVDYEVECELGTREGAMGEVKRVGGMGQVYLVHSRSTKIPFAAKRVITPDVTMRRFVLAELRTWIDLPRHPHVAAFKFFRTVDDEVVIFSEYVKGGSLGQWLRKGQLYEGGTEKAGARILDIAIQFAWGLQALHVNGVVHLDVKPDNVLITSDGIAQVSDFGLARAFASGDDGNPAGLIEPTGGMTRSYASPEQLSGRPLSAASDVWSYGVSVLEMYTGGLR